MTAGPMVLRHNRLSLALWTLREGEGRPLLCLHGLGERTGAGPPHDLSRWPGPVLGLDFSGHGASDVAVGGGYFVEALMGDVDVALAEIGEAAILGRGLGGYVALLVAGARPDLVRGAVVDDGPGLDGGGPGPSGSNWYRPPQDGSTPDPVALVELGNDVRPPDYARSFAWQAAALSGLDPALLVAARNRPPWLAEVVDQPGVATATVAEALSVLG